MDSPRIGPGHGRPARSLRPSAVAVAVLAAASALCSAYWLLGGTAGLDTVGGKIERMARERSAGAIAALALALLLKLMAVGLALELAPHGRRPRWAVLLSLLGGAFLALYGGALVVAGALALAGLLGEVEDAYSLRWHVFFWDAWFLLWGALWTLAALRARREGKAREAVAT